MINWNLLQQELPNTDEVTEVINLLQQHEHLDYDIVVSVASVIEDELTRDVVIDLVLDAIEREHPLYDAIMQELLQDVITNLDTAPEIKIEDTATWLTRLSGQAL